jgi:hypothetical protein
MENYVESNDDHFAKNNPDVVAPYYKDMDGRRDDHNEKPTP